MHTRISMLLLSGAIGMCLVGCSATSPTMRAQSPHGSCDSGHGGGGHGGVGHECPMCDSGYASAGTPMACQNGTCGHNPAECLNLPFHPVHRNFHTYDVPDNLCYPDTSVPPAMVQYPYYTFRGPTDFFMK